MDIIRRYILQLKLAFIVLKITMMRAYLQMRFNQTASSITRNMNILRHQKLYIESLFRKLEHYGEMLHGEGWTKKYETKPHLAIVPSQEE